MSVALGTETHLSNEMSRGLWGRGNGQLHTQYSQLHGAMQLLHGCRCLATVASASLKATHGYASKHAASVLSSFSLRRFLFSHPLSLVSLPPVFLPPLVLQLGRCHSFLEIKVDFPFCSSSLPARTGGVERG